MSNKIRCNNLEIVITSNGQRFRLMDYIIISISHLLKDCYLFQSLEARLRRLEL